MCGNYRGSGKNPHGHSSASRRLAARKLRLSGSVAWVRGEGVEIWKPGPEISKREMPRAWSWVTLNFETRRANPPLEGLETADGFVSYLSQAWPRPLSMALHYSFGEVALGRPQLCRGCSGMDHGIMVSIC